MKFFLHLFEKATPTEFETFLIEFTRDAGTLQDLLKEIQSKAGDTKKINTLSPGYGQAPFKNLMLTVESLFQGGEEFYVEYENLQSKIIPEDVVQELYFEPLNKYSWYDNEDGTIRVLLEIDGIGKHSKDKIEAKFLDRSVDIKIFDFKDQNYHFAAPLLAQKITPSQSKYWLKDKKVVISLKKLQKDDKWNDLQAKKGQE